MRRVVVILLAVACLVALPLASAGAAGRQGAGSSGSRGHGSQGASAVYPSQSRPLGVSYPAWAVRWSKWAFGTPLPDNPLADPTDCNIGQRGPAFLLPAPSAPGTVTTCTVPSGEPLLLAPAGNLYTPGDGVANTVPAVLAAAKAATDALTGVAATLDGKALPVQHFRTSSPFVLVLPGDNLLAAAPGPTLAAIDGYFLMLKPLCRGTHTVTTTDTFPDGSTADITITVEVVGAHRH